MKLNEVVKIECFDVSFEGKGVCKYGNAIVFVENLLPGEIAEVQLVEVKKKYAFGRVNEYIKTSDDRIKPECVYYDKCGGCSLSHMNDKLKRDVKISGILNVLKKTDLKIDVVDCMGNLSKLEYRNKNVMHTQIQDNKVVCGTYSLKSNTVIGNNCLLMSKEVQDVHSRVVELLNKCKVKVSDKKFKRDGLKNITYRYDGSNIMIIFVTTKVFEELYYISNEVKEIESVSSIYFNVTDKNKKSIIGEKDIHIYGDKTLNINLNQIVYSVSPQSFFQINTTTTVEMYDKIIELANFSKEDNVLDAYCGTGSIGLYVADYVGNVVGIDNNISAIKNANYNKSLNNIENVEFIHGDVSEIVDEMEVEFDVVIIDPPRNGCSEEFIEFINNNNFNKIIYMSCNPSTLIRDINLLSDNYKCETIYAYDMFPQTSHVETITILEKKS